MPDDPMPEGTVSFWLGPNQSHIWADGKGHGFPPFRQHGITAAATKHPDRTIELTFVLPSGSAFSFRHSIPECGTEGLMVALTWTPSEATLYLNGRPVETRPQP